VYSRPFYQDEVEDLGVINADEYHFNIGMHFLYYNQENAKHEPLDLPESIGRLARWDS